MRRLVDSLIGAVFIVAAFIEERAEAVATWADEKLMDRQVFTHGDGEEPCPEDHP